MKTWMRVGCTFSAAAALLGTCELAAQAAPLTPGETVIITWRDPVSFGSPNPLSARPFEVVSADDAQVIGRYDGQLYVIGRGAVVRVRRRIGTRPATAPEMVAGSAIGFAVGFLVGSMSATENRVDIGLSTGVLLGAPAGALVAWASSRSRGIYEDVPLPDVRARRSAATGRVHVDVLRRLLLH